VAMNRVLVSASIGLAGWCGCNGDYTLERKGGPFPMEPVIETAGTGGTASMSVGGEGGGVEPIKFCDALVVVRNKCQRCHGNPLQNAAPVAFLKQEDFQAPYYSSTLKWWEAAVDVVGRDVMPLVALNDPPTSLMPPVEPLTLDEKSTLLGWLKDGALAEGGTDCP
jgi:hypothetical protein